MAVHQIAGQQIVVDDFDVSCRIKQWGFAVDYDELDTTAVCTSGWHEGICANPKWTLNVGNGMLDFAASQVDAKLGIGGSVFATRDKPVSLMPAPAGGADGEVAFFGRALQTSYHILGQTNQLAPFSFDARGSSYPLVRGKVLHPSTSARSASGNGTGYQLGAVTATQSIFLALHVLSISGAPTFAVILESDDNSNFTSATTRITSANYSASTGSELQKLAGAVTDDYWRVRWTVSGGTAPSISFLATVGIATYV